MAGVVKPQLVCTALGQYIMLSVGLRQPVGLLVLDPLYLSSVRRVLDSKSRCDGSNVRASCL